VTQYLRCRYRLADSTMIPLLATGSRRNLPVVKLEVQQLGSLTPNHSSLTDHTRILEHLTTKATALPSSK